MALKDFNVSSITESNPLDTLDEYDDGDETVYFTEKEPVQLPIKPEIFENEGGSPALKLLVDDLMVVHVLGISYALVERKVEYRDEPKGKLPY